MISPFDLWAAIDKFAGIKCTTLVELATKAGLPPEAFLPENRVSAKGKVAWPSFEAITLLITAAGANIREFGQLVDEAEAGSRQASAQPSQNRKATSSKHL